MNLHRDIMQCANDATFIFGVPSLLRLHCALEKKKKKVGVD